MSEKSHVLVVDDDARLREVLQRYLTAQDFIVLTADGAKDAIEKLKRFEFDIAVLDVMMPEEDGISLAKKITKFYPDLPILLLTALGEADSRIKGLEAGADDYMAKPFEPRELLLRLNAILKRTKKYKPKTISSVNIGEYEYSITRQELKNSATGEILALTSTEKHLLSCLAEKAGQVVTREELADISNVSASGRTVDVQVTRLRKKIENNPKNPKYLQTVRGKGYILRTEA